MKKTFLISLLTLFVMISVQASDHHHHHKKKSLSAHVHGHVELNLVVESNKLAVMMEAPAESLLGFEHKPKNKKEKKALADAKNLWTTEIKKLFGPKTLSDCKIESTKWENHYEGNHSEIEAEAILICPSTLVGRALQFELKKHFPKIKKIELNLVTNKKAQRLEVKVKSYELKL